MANNAGRVSSGECTLVAATEKTLLQLKAATNVPIKITKITPWGKQAAGGTDAPSKIRLTLSTANFGTATGTTTPGHKDPHYTETFQGTYSQNFTTEPTSPTDLTIWGELNPQLMVVDPQDILYPVIVPGGDAINIAATNAGTPIVGV